VTVKAKYGALFQTQWGTLPHHAEVGEVEETGPVGEAWVHQELGEPVTNVSNYCKTTKL
jgi:hypothetical protein